MPMYMHMHDHPAGNDARFAPLNADVTLMRASFADHAFARHSHAGFALGATTFGVQRFRCKGRRYDSRPGDLVLFNPDEDHDGSPGTAAGFGYAIWYLSEAFVRDCVDGDAGLAGEPYFAAPHVTDVSLAARFGALTHSLLDAPSESLRVESTLRALLGTLLVRHGERMAPGAAHRVGPGALARVKEYMRSEFRRDITVAELAQVAGLSRAHLTRAFGAAFHVAPHVYLNALRIGHAQALIRAGMPLAAVALECGFADQSHFTRRFKGSVGIAPATWRRAFVAAG